MTTDFGLGKEDFPDTLERPERYSETLSCWSDLSSGDMLCCVVVVLVVGEVVVWGVTWCWKEGRGEKALDVGMARNKKREVDNIFIVVIGDVDGVVFGW